MGMIDETELGWSYEGLLPRQNPYVGFLHHAPSSGSRMRYYTPRVEHESLKRFRNNPYSGTFHTAPGHYSQLHFIARNDKHCWTWKSYETRRKEADNIVTSQNKIHNSSSENVLYSLEPEVWLTTGKSEGQPNESPKTRSHLADIVENRRFLGSRSKRERSMASFSSSPQRRPQSSMPTSISATELITFGSGQQDKNDYSGGLSAEHARLMSLTDGESAGAGTDFAVGKTYESEDAAENEDIGFQYESSTVGPLYNPSDGSNSSSRQDPANLFLEGRPEELSGITIGIGPLAASLSSGKGSGTSHSKWPVFNSDSGVQRGRSGVTIPLSVHDDSHLVTSRSCSDGFVSSLNVDDSRRSNTSSVLDTQNASKSRLKPVKWILPTDLLTYGRCEKSLEESPVADDGTVDVTALQYHYDLGKRLGSGTFANVHHTRLKHNGAERVVKLVQKRFLFSPEERDSVKREVEILKNLSHPHIAHLYAVFENPQYVILVMENVSGGNLKHYIDTGNRGSRRFPEHCVRRLAEQLLECLDYLHNTKHIIHCDIKPENVVLAQTLAASHSNEGAGSSQPAAQSLLPPGIGMYDVVKLVDFGNCRRSKDARYFKQTGDVARVPFEAVTGTSGYIAPEILDKKSFDTSVDMWSLGVMLYQLLAGFQPFMAQAGQKGQPSFDCSPWNDGTISAEARSFVQGLLQVDPSRRLRSKKARSHAWFS
eukprot:gb/GECG01009847.1/.p1 GENE.gb/GECG01009847.1/~~gb/GECG01009847.1/.p1  ORF type:complete len:710 (+),score=67.64 gb/GECG01009847.1/:1-2130(+)